MVPGGQRARLLRRAAKHVRSRNPFQWADLSARAITADTMTTTRYEDLVGGVGKAVSYRAERFPVRALLAQQEVTLIAADQEYPVEDVSMNGLSLLVPPDDATWVEGSTVELTVVARDRAMGDDGHSHADEIYRGRACVARTADKGSSRQVGLRLVGGFIDLAQVQWNHYDRLFRGELDSGPDSVRDLVPPPYRAAVEHAVHFLQSLRRTVSRYECLMEEKGEGDQRTINELPRQVIDKVRNRWNAIREEAAASAPSWDGDSKRYRAAKAYSETMLTPLLMDCPVLQRAYKKPLGYAGDYQTMVQIYANGFEGSSALDKVFHKLACEEPLAAGVRNRKDAILELLRQEYESFCRREPNDPAFRITSIASGPAREVGDFIGTQSTWPRPVECTLLDQEHAALSLAYHELYPRLQTAHVPMSLSCVYLSFMQLLRGPSVGLSSERQHFIYAAGLFDYLGNASARSLLADLYRRLTPGGLLVVCNAVWPNRHFWVTEYVCDWHLIYRTAEEMLRLSAGTTPGSTTQLVEEPSSAYHILLVRRE
jgi:extracellular factor (EF) 3-hydroxypalmitic acid methyl ester biosynthesis protein